MEPQMQYCKTSDGVSIAYYAIGDGPPLVVMSAGLHQSIEFDWKVTNFRQAAEVSARTFTYVRYDPRGSGLSDRDVDDFTLEAMARDLEAVVEALGFDQVRLFAAGPLGLVAATFAARQPERLSHLVLWVSSVRGTQFLKAPLRQRRDFVETDWRVASEAIVQTVDHWDNAALARQHAEMMRASVEPGTYLRFVHATDEWDVSAMLPAITCKTLVIHPASNPYFPIDPARELAAALPNARLSLVEGRSVLMPGMEVIRIAGAFFLDGAQPRPAAARGPSSGRTAIILFADIADSTALTERLGDAPFRERARELDAALRRAIVSNGGTVIEGKLLGDGSSPSLEAAGSLLNIIR
jgi:pimeloyl-ACP methyl ester carboxylesterase